MKLMIAAILYAPGDIRVEQVPVPEPGPGEVLIKVKACGVCGSDLPRLMQTGTYHYPTIPGHELAGDVAAMGSEVNDVEPGLRVTAMPQIPCGSCDCCASALYHLCENYNYLGSRTNGAFAEYVVVPARNILPLPEKVSYELGAMTDPISIAVHALKTARLQPGNSVCVFGVGPIGNLVIQLARIMGASTVTAVDIFPEKLEIAAAMGADCCLNSREVDPVAEILKNTGGRGIDRVLEFAGNKTTQDYSLRVAGKNARVVWGGISHTGCYLSAKTVDKILRREITLAGVWNSSVAPLDSDWFVALDLLAKGLINGEILISHRCALGELPRMFQMMQQGTYYNKVMFLPELKC